MVYSYIVALIFATLLSLSCSDEELVCQDCRKKFNVKRKPDFWQCHVGRNAMHMSLFSCLLLRIHVYYKLYRRARRFAELVSQETACYSFNFSFRSSKISAKTEPLCVCMLPCVACLILGVPKSLIEYAHNARCWNRSCDHEQSNVSPSIYANFKCFNDVIGMIDNRPSV